jgi:DNA-binding transcriptional regulator YiaG
MTPEKVKKARQSLGLTQSELANWLKLASKNGGDTVRSWETQPTSKRHRPITGPAQVAIEAFIDGWTPSHIKD